MGPPRAPRRLQLPKILQLRGSSAPASEDTPVSNRRFSTSTRPKSDGDEMPHRVNYN